DNWRGTDRAAVHQPFLDRAAGALVPENVRLAVTVEVAGADHRPAGRHGADIGGSGNGAAVHLQFLDRAVGVAQEDVGLAVTVEVAGAARRPARRNAVCDNRRGTDRAAVHQPFLDRAAGALVPENVRLAVTVEVAGADHRPAGRHGADIGGSGNGAPVHLQFLDRAVGVAQEDVGLAVTVEVAGADRRPARRNAVCDNRRGTDRAAVHQPVLDRAAGARVPENVRLAVTVEVAGADHRPAGRHGADIGGSGNGAPVHLQFLDRAVGVAQEDVSLAVTVEVAGADRRPARRNAVCDNRRGTDRAAVHQPFLDRAAG